jgi:HTH-type transcriptional regulator/antitoxin HipB
MSPLDDFCAVHTLSSNGDMATLSSNGDTMQIRTPLDLGHAIRERRKQLELDQRELADRVGVSRQWLVEIERGKPRAEVGLLLRVLRELELRLETLAPGEARAAAKRRGRSAPAKRGAPRAVACRDSNALIYEERGQRSGSSTRVPRSNE